MMNEMSLSQSERTNAMLAHGGVVLGVFSRGVLGILVAFLIWYTQRDKSRFAARQAAQATIYQLIGFAVTLSLWVSWGIVFFSSIMVPVLFNPRRPEPMMLYTMIPAFGLMLVPITVMFLWFVYGLYAANEVWHGNDFSYPLIGKWVK
jgi:uncharacterized Tic20 family protein